MTVSLMHDGMKADNKGGSPMADIQIDTSQLTYPQFLIPGRTASFVDGSANPRPTVVLPEGSYSFQQASGYFADFTFRVRADGKVDYDAGFDGFLGGRGTSMLAVKGFPVHVDFTALQHDLLPLIAGGQFLTHAHAQDIRLVPASHYGFQPGSGIVATFEFQVGADGHVSVPPAYSTFATASAGNLTITGHAVRIDGRALAHDLLPISLTGYTGGFLPHATINEIRIIPAAGYGFQPGAGVVADLAYTLNPDGTVHIDPSYSGFAATSGNVLTIAGRLVRIDGRSLSHDLLPISLAGYSGGVLSRLSVNELTLIPAVYDFQPGAGIVATFIFAVGRDGNVVVDPKYAGVASVSGNLLRIMGARIRIDGRGLSHDLLPISLLGYNAGFMPRSRINELTLIPAVGYSFQPGAGVVADMNYTVGIDGHVSFPANCAAFLSGAGTDTLVIDGYPVLVDARQADADLVSLANIGIAAEARHYLFAVLIPANGYVPQTAHGVFTHGFAVERNGSITFPATLAGRYVVTPIPRLEIHGATPF